MHGQDGSGQRYYSDKGFEWRPGRLYIPAWQFAGLDYEVTTATDIKSMGTGAANDTSIVEINTSGVTALDMTANANSVQTFLMMPQDLDLQKNIYFRIWWTANNTSGSVTWDVLYKSFVADTTVLGTAPAATVLTTAIGSDAMAAAAYTIMRSPEGILAGGTLAENVEALQLGVVRTSVATITTASFLGLELRYSPRRLRGPDGMAKEAKSPIYIAAKQYT